TRAQSRAPASQREKGPEIEMLALGPTFRASERASRASLSNGRLGFAERGSPKRGEPARGAKPLSRVLEPGEEGAGAGEDAVAGRAVEVAGEAGGAGGAVAAELEADLHAAADREDGVQRALVQLDAAAVGARLRELAAE